MYGSDTGSVGGTGAVVSEDARRVRPESAFEILRDEPERFEGVAPGIDRAHLRRLRRGEVPPDEEVDLHGLDRKQARHALHAALQRAIDEGGRCVRVIHGRGVHSADGSSVLRAGLARWLAEPPYADRVMAFATGLGERGGATYVLLRRRR